MTGPLCVCVCVFVFSAEFQFHEYSICFLWIQQWVLMQEVTAVRK